MPVYNGGPHLREAIDCILGQTYADFELIISDNASTDETEVIAREAAKRDSRVRVLRNPTNIGLAGNYNRLLDEARGELFKWATADDVCLPRFLEECTKTLDARPDAVLAYPKVLYIDASGNRLQVEDQGMHLDSGDPAERLRGILAMPSWVNSILGVIRRDPLLHTGRLPTYPSGDYGLLGELCIQGKFLEIPEPLLLRRLHPRASSQMKGDRGWMEWYWGGKRGMSSTPNWNRAAHHFSTIRRSELGVRRQISLLWFLFRTLNWQRGQYCRETLSLVLRRIPRGPNKRPGEA
jgi:glycosyltransferase involved in cell wall biosynthesis